MSNRDYLSVSEASKTIAAEVVETGASKGWATVNGNNLGVAKDLERHLAKFNIGYTDAKTGTWGARMRGTRYFSTMNFIAWSKDKASSVVSGIKKRALNK